MFICEKESNEKSKILLHEDVSHTLHLNIHQLLSKTENLLVLIQYLNKKGASIEAKEKDQLTHLHIALIKDKTNVIKTQLEKSDKILWEIANNDEIS